MTLPSTLPVWKWRLRPRLRDILEVKVIVWGDVGLL